MKITIDEADRLFSIYIRQRDRQCVRCDSLVKFNNKGLPISHESSHFYGRGHESTRFEPDNADTLCMPCHRRWGSDDREDYRAFKLKQLGQKRFNSLLLQSNTYKRKDRKLERIKWRAVIQT